MAVKIEPIILTVPATGYLEFDIDIPWSIQNLTKYEMRFAQEKASIIKGDYFPLFGFGLIDKGVLTSDKFVVYNPDASGRNIALNYGEQAIAHSKVDSIVTSDKVPVTESSPVNPGAPETVTSEVIAGNVQVDFATLSGYAILITHAQYLEKQAATPTIHIRNDTAQWPYTDSFTVTASVWNNLFQPDDKPFYIGPTAPKLILEVANGHANDEWIISGIEVRS